MELTKKNASLNSLAAFGIELIKKNASSNNFITFSSLKLSFAVVKIKFAKELSIII